MAQIKCWLGFGWLALLFSIFAIVLTVSLYSYKQNHALDDYAIVYDAGSSGTRMHIYKWKSGYSAARGDPISVNEDDFCYNDDKGIDKIKSQEQADRSFAKCMNNSKHIIPTDRQHRAYITLAATAGMRLLHAKNPERANNVLSYIRKIFNQSNYYYKNESQVRTISGQEEGINGWISVNYFEQKFDANKKLETIGILDLGGASTQIAFVPKEEHENKTDVQIKIYGKAYKIYAKSYLCWGQNEFFRLYENYLLIKNNFAKTISASCYPTRYAWTTTIIEDNVKPCTEALLPNSSKLLEHINETFSFDGTSDIQMCETEIKYIIEHRDFHKLTKIEPNVEDSIPPDPSSYEFLAYSAFYYAFSNTKKVTNKTFSEDRNEFINTTRNICSMSNVDLEQINTHKINNNETKSVINGSRLPRLCISNVYVIQLFDFYGIKDLNKINFEDKVGLNKKNHIGWTLGYLITELNRDDFLPYEQPPRMLHFNHFLPLVIVSVLMLVIVVVLMVICKYRQRNRTKRRETNL